MHPFVVTRRVEYADTDMAGIVHFTQFYQYMEATEHALFRSFNVCINHKLDDGHIMGWPRRSCAFEFSRPLRFEDEFDVQLSIDRIGNKSVTYSADIVHHGTVVASGTSTSVCCQIELGTGCPPEAISIPDWIREHLRPYLKEASP
ncbi:MAG TPA: hypothetical protein DCR55_17180 [Lentisphaeria bacterium]|nr:hypothetical protein [Lentisphaeria bacterium]